MKKDGSSAIGYVLLFSVLMILSIMTLYMLQKAKLMTMQRDVDDALSDALLASLVADDVYYFETYEETGRAVIRFKNVDESYSNFKDIMNATMSNSGDFYQNVAFDELILYEVDEDYVTVTSFIGNEGLKYTGTYLIDLIETPEGDSVTKTSAYAKVSFDIKSMIDGSLVRKSRDLYCTFEFN